MHVFYEVLYITKYPFHCVKFISSSQASGSLDTKLVRTKLSCHRNFVAHSDSLDLPVVSFLFVFCLTF